MPDASGRLPGRGGYCLPDRALLAAAVAAHHAPFARALKRPVRVPPDIVQRTEDAAASFLAGAAVRGAAAAATAADAARAGATPPPPPLVPPWRRRSVAARPAPAKPEEPDVWTFAPWDGGASVPATSAVNAPPTPQQQQQQQQQQQLRVWTPPPPRSRAAASRTLVLFALTSAELEATAAQHAEGRSDGSGGVAGGGVGEAAARWERACAAAAASWLAGSDIRLPRQVSLRLAAAQFRLEGLRPGCRPSGVTTSGEAEAATTVGARPGGDGAASRDKQHGAAAAIGS